ncbi:hypothetical protein ACIPSE_13740 [Streptomyces sp. NPDC090106]|uniref:hypothetical protein n=1 Tax=Streptomyces sp. NPDC090106 TaxID=3365946 RepID=UPI003814DDDC
MSRTRGGNPLKSGLSVALAGLCAMALAGCGTERAGGSGAGPEASAAPRARAEAARQAEESGKGDDASGGSEFIAFMELLNEVAEPCLPDLPAPPPPAAPEGEGAPEPGTLDPEALEKGPREAPLPELPALPEEPPPGGPVDPRAEAELSSVEECDARQHIRRITAELDGTADPAPGEVGAALRRLGYIEERIEGPRRSGGGVAFTLDLRLMGGRLCLDGTATAGRTVVEPYGAGPDADCSGVAR